MRAHAHDYDGEAVMTPQKAATFARIRAPSTPADMHLQPLCRRFHDSIFRSVGKEAMLKTDDGYPDLARRYRKKVRKAIKSEIAANPASVFLTEGCSVDDLVRKAEEKLGSLLKNARGGMEQGSLLC
jgi:hypothetical protein